MAPVHVLIISDDPLTRGGMAALLADQPQVQIIGQAEIVEEAEELVDLFRPELVLLAAVQWTEAVVALTQSLRDLHVPVVALADGEHQAALYAASGARGILARDASAADMGSAIAAAASGLIVLSPTLGRSLLRPGAPTSGDSPPLSPSARMRCSGFWHRASRTSPLRSAYASANTP